MHRRVDHRTSFDSIYRRKDLGVLFMLKLYPLHSINQPKYYHWRDISQLQQFLTNSKPLIYLPYLTIFGQSAQQWRRLRIWSSRRHPNKGFRRCCFKDMNSLGGYWICKKVLDSRWLECERNFEVSSKYVSLARLLSLFLSRETEQFLFLIARSLSGSFI